MFLATASATAPHADTWHSGPVDSENASLKQELKAAEQKVHENAAAARKAAHGDGSDSFANDLEKSMMALEKEDQENQDRAKARHQQHEIDRKVAHARTPVMTPEVAAKELEETAEGIRKAAHGDGSDRWANELEETVMDLEEMKHENEEKAKERHARHQHAHEVLEQQIHARQEAFANAHKKAATVVRQSQHEANSKERHAQHVLEEQVRREVLNAQQPMYSHTHPYQPVPVDKQQTSSNADIVQSGANAVLFMLFAGLFGMLVWWKKFVHSNSQSVHVPGVGKVDAVQTERLVMGLLARVSPNASLYVYQDDSRASAPLKSPFTGPKAGYGVFTL
eukprot:gnl/MRDRNA2_/MRDRNA2_87005_c0_seq1.p1 gnl/MRDRNA2_/MRDRNA2_87005_c0~~gnl/MRDRNA2_/MRDRNA2_87005_c0_seq1.p1  ORF type:complete len:381 (-),score=91.04 gnl/MRDRNA2_/MRDRNA2_87005_c0_seq1:72-1082(-)